MLEYRGYGLSQGSPSEEGLYMDARTALDFLSLRHDVNHKEIIVFGRSLGKLLHIFHSVFKHFSENGILYANYCACCPGGAVAIDVAVQPEYASRIWCLILENTFTSIPDMAKVLIGWRVLQYLPLCFYKNKVHVMLYTKFYKYVMVFTIKSQHNFFCDSFFQCGRWHI
jgi:hypothetical protein